MDEGFARLVIVPVGIALFVFFFEWIAAQAKGIQVGKRKYKLWIDDSGDTYPELPRHIGDVKAQIGLEIQHARKKLVDITELTSIESFTGLGFDLVAASLTADILAYYKASQAGIPIPALTSWLVIHLLFLLVVASLAISNGKAKPTLEALGPAPGGTGRSPVHRQVSDWFSAGENRRTCLAVLVGVFSLITSFIYFWEALL